jgi:predicted O-linked N-acetylglucosamine transferase (SPINDLY family)
LFCNFNDHRKLVESVIFLSAFRMIVFTHSRIPFFLTRFAPETFDAWLRVLKRVPGSVLWVLDRGISSRFLKKYVEKAGIDPKRLIIAGMHDPYFNIWRLTLCDLWLDNRVYGALTGHIDATWAGVPLLVRSVFV